MVEKGHHNFVLTLRVYSTRFHYGVSNTFNYIQRLTVIHQNSSAEPSLHFLIPQCLLPVMFQAGSLGGASSAIFVLAGKILSLYN